MQYYLGRWKMEASSKLQEQLYIRPSLYAHIISYNRGVFGLNAVALKPNET